MFIGSRSRTRTCDPVINSHLLYRLSYPGMALNTVRSIRIGHIRSRADLAGQTYRCGNGSQMHDAHATGVARAS
jgi:hypothetical protein